MVFLHGFGSTKEDYVDLAYQPAFANRPFLAYDVPGCGETFCACAFCAFCADLSKISILFLYPRLERVGQRLDAISEGRPVHAQ